MEEQGDLRSGGDVTEGSAGLPPRRPVARTPAPCFRAPWRRRAAYRWMQVSCGGQGTAWALPGRERTPGPGENPCKIPSPGPRGSSGLPRLLPRGMVLLTGPRFAAGECLLKTPSTGGRGCLHGEGVWSLGDRGLSGHSSFLRSSDQTLESGSRQVQVCLLEAGGGSLSQGRTLNRPGRAQA